MMQMISRPTSAMATTSVRRMIGGNSPLLSGSGAFPFVGKLTFAGRRFCRRGCGGQKPVGEGLFEMTLTMVFPRPKRR